MIKLLLAISILVISVSCNSGERKNSPSAATDNDTASTGTSVSVEVPSTQNSDWSGCYRMTIQKDSAYMNLSKAAGGYDGSLEYKRFEKDSNKGTLSLLEDEKYLKGWYRFQSEGTISVREVYFRKSKKGLEEGYGEVTMLGDTVLYKYPATLNFENKHPFTKIICN